MTLAHGLNQLGFKYPDVNQSFINELLAALPVPSLSMLRWGHFLHSKVNIATWSSASFKLFILQMLASRFGLAAQIPLRKTYVLVTLMLEKKWRAGRKSEIIVNSWQVKCCDFMSDTEPVPSEWTSEMFFSRRQDACIPLRDEKTRKSCQTTVALCLDYCHYSVMQDSFIWNNVSQMLRKKYLKRQWLLIWSWT